MPKDCSFFANADAYGCEADFPKWFGMSGKIKDYCRASCNICDNDGKYFDNTNVYLRYISRLNSFILNISIYYYRSMDS